MSVLADIEMPLNTLEAMTRIVGHFIGSESPVRDCELDHIHLQLEQSVVDIKHYWDKARAEFAEEREAHAAALAEARAETAAAKAAASPLSGAELSRLLALRDWIRALATHVMAQTGSEETSA